MNKKLYTREYKPVPPISDGKLNYNNMSPLAREKVKRLVTPIFNKALKETSKNHVSVGGVGSENYQYAYYNPHNARFYFNYIKTEGSGGGRLEDLRIINKSEFCHENFLGCRIVVKKNKLEITNKINKDRRFKISGSAEDRYKQTVEAVAVLECEVIATLKEFIKVYPVDSDCVCVKAWIPDNKILHDKIIDSIPQEVTFRNDVVKKVYNTKPSNVEVSSPVQASNTFRNLALYDYAPMIAEELENLRSEIMKGVPLVNPLENVKLGIVCFPDDVIACSDDIIALSDFDKALLSEWLFSEFGGVV